MSVLTEDLQKKLEDELVEEKLVDLAMSFVTRRLPRTKPSLSSLSPKKSSPMRC